MTNISAAEKLVALLREKHLTVAAAESCTGGMVSGEITSAPGASEVFPGGVVSYANEVKAELLKVPEEILRTDGAVSFECARAMLTGVRNLLRTNCAICTTGIAGPGGGTPEKPVGLVFTGAASPDRIVVRKNLFRGTREEIRRQSAAAVLAMLTDLLEEKNVL